ncbi:MAG: hypothetical protein LUE31_01240 [Lachnospiraceae bacterium]|nr:hypothetical protein [Lachnospiraceae bacterium]
MKAQKTLYLSAKPTRHTMLLAKRAKKIYPDLELSIIFERGSNLLLQNQDSLDLSSLLKYRIEEEENLPADKLPVSFKIAVRDPETYSQLLETVRTRLGITRVSSRLLIHLVLGYLVSMEDAKDAGIVKGTGQKSQEDSMNQITILREINNALINLMLENTPEAANTLSTICHILNLDADTDNNK